MEISNLLTDAQQWALHRALCDSVVEELWTFGLGEDLTGADLMEACDFAAARLTPQWGDMNDEYKERFMSLLRDSR